jgi:surfactin synthase thioesterase subunit
MVAVVMAVTVFVVALAALFIAYLPDKRNKAVTQQKKDLQALVDKLNQEIQQKDKELEARRLGLPWYDVE